MTNSIFASAFLGMRMVLAITLLLGPLTLIGMTRSDEITVAKKGAGLVLFVSLQRQSMS